MLRLPHICRTIVALSSKILLLLIVNVISRLLKLVVHVEHKVALTDERDLLWAESGRN